MSQVEILVGSKSDLQYLLNSNLIERLEQNGVTCVISVCSAHRNASDLRKRINETYDHTAVYVCAAGMAAALPGAVKAELLGRSLAAVFGIALPSKDYPDGNDAEISIKRLPPGIDVIYGGVGTDGFDSIADDVIGLARAYDPVPDPVELAAVRAKIKPPHFDIDPRSV